jgi:hypothetical protein
MVVSNSERKPRDVSRIMRIGGYVLLIGSLVGITLGVYALFNPRFFLVFLNISEYEAPSFFLGVYLPGLVVTVGVGYVFASKSKLRVLETRHAAVLCTIVVLCLTFASLSVFNILAVAGGVIALVSVVLAQTRPSFKVLWKREASFFVEIGSMLIMSASMLFLFMLIISRFLRTYSAGVYSVGADYPYVLVAIAAVSFLTFAVTPFMGLKGSKTGLVAILAFVSSVSSSIAAIQNEYVYSNPAIYQGLSVLGIGVALAFTGGVVYLRLSISGELLNTPLDPSFIYKGRHCPHCGVQWKDSSQHVCPNCNQNLYSEELRSFCPHCGRLIHAFAKNCPHCGEDVSCLPVHISFKPLKETKGLFRRILESLELSVKQFVAIVILIILFNFISYVGYVRIIFPALVTVGSKTIFTYGVPLEWLQVVAVWDSRESRTPGLFRWYLNYAGLSVNYAAFILDLAIYFLLAFTIVYGGSKLRARWMRLR